MKSVSNVPGRGEQCIALRNLKRTPGGRRGQVCTIGSPEEGVSLTSIQNQPQLTTFLKNKENTDSMVITPWDKTQHTRLVEPTQKSAHTSRRVRQRWINVRFHGLVQSDIIRFGKKLCSAGQRQQLSDIRLQDFCDLDGVATRSRPGDFRLVEAGMFALDVICPVDRHRAEKRREGFFGSRLRRRPHTFKKPFQAIQSSGVGTNRCCATNPAGLSIKLVQSLDAFMHPGSSSEPPANSLTSATPQTILSDPSLPKRKTKGKQVTLPRQYR